MRFLLNPVFSCNMPTSTNALSIPFAVAGVISSPSLTSLELTLGLEYNNSSNL